MKNYEEIQKEIKGFEKVLESIEGVKNICPQGLSYFFEIEPKSNQEKLEVEISFTYVDNSNKKSLPNLWYKEGYTDSVLDSYIGLKTYYTLDGECVEKFNPTVKGFKINFEKLYTVNEENIKKLLEEVISLYKAI